MKINKEEYIKFGQTLTKEQQLEFVNDIKNLDTATKINPEIIIDGFNMLSDKYPKLKEYFNELS